MEPHGRPLLVIGVIGSILIIALTAGGTSSKSSASGPTPALTATAVIASPTALPSPTATPLPEPAPQAEPPANRLNCDAIRGTRYLSGEERAWFIDNCS